MTNKGKKIVKAAQRDASPTKEELIESFDVSDSNELEMTRADEDDETENGNTGC